MTIKKWKTQTLRCKREAVETVHSTERRDLSIIVFITISNYLFKMTLKRRRRRNRWSWGQALIQVFAISLPAAAGGIIPSTPLLTMHRDSSSILSPSLPPISVTDGTELRVGGWYVSLISAHAQYRLACSLSACSPCLDDPGCEVSCPPYSHTPH